MSNLRTTCPMYEVGIAIRLAYVYGRFPVTGASLVHRDITVRNGINLIATVSKRV